MFRFTKSRGPPDRLLHEENILVSGESAMSQTQSCFRKGHWRVLFSRATSRKKARWK